MTRDKKTKIVSAAGAASGTSKAQGVGTWRIHGELPEDHHFYKIIGRVASEWAHLEHGLDITIWELLRWKTTGLKHAVMASVTSQIMGVGPRCKVIQSLGSARGIDETTLKGFRQLASASFPVADWRARWIHDPWFAEIGPGTPAQFRAMPQADPRYGLCDITEEEMQRTLSEIRILRQQASDLHNKVHSELRSSE